MSEPTLDRASFLLGYLTARLDCAADIVDMVAQAEAYLDGEAVPLPALAVMDPQPEQEPEQQPEQEEPEKAPAPKPKAPQKATPKPKQPKQPKVGAKRQRVVEMTKEGLTAREIAKSLGSSIGSVEVMRVDARKRGELPPAAKPGEASRDVGASARDVTAELMGDPAPGRSAE